MLRKIGLPIAALLMFVSVASAQVTLKMKYPEGTKYSTQTEATTSQTLTLVGMDIETKSTTFVTSVKSIGKRAADGNLKVEEKVKSMQSEISLPGGLSITFDSANPNKPAAVPQLEPILTVFRTICDHPVTVELNSKDKITSVKLPEGEFEKLPEEARDRFTSETLVKSGEQAIDFLPDGPVKKGDTWERSGENNLGAGQKLSFRTKFEYAGTVEKDGVTLDKITGKAFEVNYSVDGNPMLQVTKSDLKVEESETTYLFNREEGYIVSKTSKTRLVGPLTLVINNMELPGKVDLTMEEKSSRQK